MSEKIIRYNYVYYIVFSYGIYKMEQNIHEILGFIMIVCFILHHIVNIQWYKTIYKGKMTTIKIIFIIVNCFLLADVILLALSGITMSSILPFLNFMPVSLARRLHMISSYWGFVFMAIHLGLHIQSFLFPFRKRIKTYPQIINIIICWILPYALMLLGVFMFIKNHFITYLFMLSEFIYVDKNKNIVIFIFEYLSVFVLFIILTYNVMKFMKDRRKENVKENIK